MQNFVKNQSGNIAVTSALIAVPLFAIAGGLLDFANVYNKNSSVQNGLDAAVLASGVEMANLTDSQIQNLFDANLQSNLSPENYDSIQSTNLNIDRNAGTLTAQLDSNHPTTLLNLIGMSNITYRNDAAIQAGAPGGAEVVLALDTTYSMLADGKIDALKTAAEDFAESLLANNAVSNRVKIGIVPFEKYVNVGTQHRNAPWIDVDADTTKEVCWNEAPIISKSGCTWQDKIIDGTVVGTEEYCSNIEYGEAVEQCSTRISTWNGCVGSRDAPRHVQDGYYANKIPGISNITCGNPILPLTTNKHDILDAIEALTPFGETYMAAGMTWSLRAISDGQPFSEGVSYTKMKSNHGKKYIVLMTDGENTYAPNETYFKIHDAQDPERADEYTLDACAEAKSNEIEIFTIGFGSAITTQTKALMEECATTQSNYYPAINANELQSAFRSISSEINAVFLSK